MDRESMLTGQGDDLKHFEALNQRPSIAWPTLMLLAVAFVVFGLSTLAYVQGVLPLF